MKVRFCVLLVFSLSTTVTADESQLTHNELSLDHDHGSPRDTQQTAEDETNTISDCCPGDLLTALEVRLRTAENQIENLKKENRVQAEEINQLRTESLDTSRELLQHKAQLTQIISELNDKPNVAFAAALGNVDHVGPSDRESTLVFRNILTNIGYAYNTATGIFSAPVRGVYYFSVSTFTFDKEKNACVSLNRNHERLLTACDHSSPDGSDTANNGAAVQLEAGDHVYITLHAFSKVYDDHHNRSCFRGFLLFTL